MKTTGKCTDRIMVKSKLEHVQKSSHQGGADKATKTAAKPPKCGRKGNFSTYYYII